MADDDKDMIRDPSKQGWLSDICSLPDELKVTVSGVRKLPGRPREYANGEGTYYTLERYRAYTVALIGVPLNPCDMWREMGHDIDCTEE